MSAVTEKTSKSPGVVSVRRSVAGAAVTGAILGGLLAFCIHEVCRGIVPFLGSDYVLPAGLLVGFVVGFSRLRWTLWAASAAVLMLVGVVGFTPVMKPLVHRLAVRDPVQAAPAVVVLASDVYEDGSLTASGQARILHAYELLRQGWAPRLVLSHGSRFYVPWSKTVRQQMERLRLDYPIDETPSVENTRDEALAVAKLAREKRWDRVLLVTHPWHMWRAAAVFRKAGVRVICSPCEEIDYDFNSLLGFGSRLAAFRDWAHEAIGYRIYKLRGWV